MNCKNYISKKGLFIKCLNEYGFNNIDIYQMLNDDILPGEVIKELYLNGEYKHKNKIYKFNLDLNKLEYLSPYLLSVLKEEDLNNKLLSKIQLIHLYNNMDKLRNRKIKITNEVLYFYDEDLISFDKMKVLLDNKVIDEYTFIYYINNYKEEKSFEYSNMVLYTIQKYENDVSEYNVREFILLLNAYYKCIALDNVLRNKLEKEFFDKYIDIVKEEYKKLRVMPYSYLPNYDFAITLSKSGIRKYLDISIFNIFNLDYDYILYQKKEIIDKIKKYKK